jgi:hypothetical protein
VCDMCGATEPPVADEEGGPDGEQAGASSAGWVWCPGCEVALFCSRGCLQEARQQGVHTSQGCNQLGCWKVQALWAASS